MEIWWYRLSCMLKKACICTVCAYTVCVLKTLSNNCVHSQTVPNKSKGIYYRFLLQLLLWGLDLKINAFYFWLGGIIRTTSASSRCTEVWMQTWLSVLIHSNFVLQSMGVLRPKSMTCGNRWWTTAWALARDPCEPIRRDRSMWGWSVLDYSLDLDSQAKLRECRK